MKLLNEIRKASAPWCPVLVVSADTSEATRPMLTDFGVDSVVGKEGWTDESLARRVLETIGELTSSGRLSPQTA